MRAEKGRDTLAEGRARLVESLASAMEEDGLSWYAGWERCWSARNAATGARYRGVNRLSLAAASARCGFEDPRWVTYNQARDAGWHVRRGERAQATVEFWSWYVPIMRAGRQSVVTVQRARELVAAGRISEDDVCGDRFLRGRGAWVFNASQVEGVPPVLEPRAAEPGSEPWRVADDLIASSRCPVRETRSDDAFYAPAEDAITVPLRGQFESAEGFCRTLMHEMCHSTAGELGRPLPSDHESYAFEELVAELGSAFSAADAGLDMSAVAKGGSVQTWTQNHAAYLRSWLDEIRDDPSALARAASEASRASDLVIGRYEVTRAERARSRSRDERPLSERAGSAREAASRIAAEGITPEDMRTK